jgi:hypothetical protein
MGAIIMGMAFGISVDDVASVMANHGVTQITEDELINLFESLDGDIIEHAALAGNDMDEQTSYAHAEIASQLKDRGFLS